MRVLARAWQMLSKAIAEVQAANKPAQAAEMGLVRLAYAADLPTPDDALRRIREMAQSGAPATGGVGNGVGNGGGGGMPSGGGASAMAASGGGARLAIAARSEAPQPMMAPRASASAQPAEAEGPRLASLQDVVNLAITKRDLLLRHALETQARLVHFEEGRIEIALVPGSSGSLVQELSRKLSEWTGRRWLVSLSNREGEPTLAEVAALARNEREDGLRADPLVAAVLARFPGAQIVDVRTRDDEPPEEVLAPVLEEDNWFGPGPDDEIEF